MDRLYSSEVIDSYCGLESYLRVQFYQKYVARCQARAPGSQPAHRDTHTGPTDHILTRSSGNQNFKSIKRSD